MKNLIIGVVLSTVLLIGLGWLMVGRQTPATALDMGITENDHQTNASASATLVEYSDFQCPACRAYQDLVNQAKAEFGDRLNLVFRHFPLRSIHPHAQLAAQAAEAANLQGKFWEYHDLLFETQPEWSQLADPTETFVTIATQLELDTEKFTADMASQPLIDKVNADYASGMRFGVNSTPTFYLNGVKLQNPASYPAFKNLIQAQLGQ